MAVKKEKSNFRPLLWINYIFIILLLLSNLVPLIAPDFFWPITILGLSFPVIVIINLLFFIYWSVVFKRYLFYSLLALVLTYSLIFDHFQVNNSSKKEDNITNQISILSFNAHNLSNTNYNKGDKKIRKEIADFIHGQQADIVCFQEFQTYPTRGVNSVKDYQKILGLSHYHKIPYLEKNTHEFVDLLVMYSKYPIKNGHSYYMDGKSYGFYVDMDIKGKIVRVFNLHLESNHFGRKDYEIFSEKEVNLNEKKRNQIFLLLQKIKKYSVKRSYQARTIRNEIEKSPYPVIVAGDFNDTPASFTLQHTRAQLKDAFRQKGSGYGNTYNGNLPPMRIDYLLFDEVFSIHDFKVLKTDLSDHFPILATFEIQKEN